MFTVRTAWNVHRENGSERPQDEWVIVENAHPALITADEATAIATARQKKASRHVHSIRTIEHSQTSRYLLSGGLFSARAAAAISSGTIMPWAITTLCGSQAYRRWRMYSQEEVEELIKGLRERLALCADRRGSRGW